MEPVKMRIPPTAVNPLPYPDGSFCHRWSQRCADAHPTQASASPGMERAFHKSACRGRLSRIIWYFGVKYFGLGKESIVYSRVR